MYDFSSEGDHLQILQGRRTWEHEDNLFYKIVKDVTQRETVIPADLHRWYRQDFVVLKMKQLILKMKHTKFNWDSIE